MRKINISIREVQQSGPFIYLRAYSAPHSSLLSSSSFASSTSPLFLNKSSKELALSKSLFNPPPGRKANLCAQMQQGGIKGKTSSSVHDERRPSASRMRPTKLDLTLGAVWKHRGRPLMNSEWSRWLVKTRKDRFQRNVLLHSTGNEDLLEQLRERRRDTKLLDCSIRSVHKFFFYYDLLYYTYLAVLPEKWQKKNTWIKKTCNVFLLLLNTLV